MPESARYLNLDVALEIVASAQHLLLATDFDGTLSEIVDDPGTAEPVDRAGSVLEQLAELDDTTVVVVSGRSHVDLASRLGALSGVHLIGEHGNDTGGEPDADPRMPEIERFVDELRDRHGPFRVERKNRSLAVHTRELDGPETEAITSSIEQWSLANPWAKLLRGKEVFELSLAARTKADAVADLRSPGAVVVFFGDDVTDEDVFVDLADADLGVKVGAGPTAARFSVGDPHEVVALLRRLAHSRRQAQSQ